MLARFIESHCKGIEFCRISYRRNRFNVPIQHYISYLGYELHVLNQTKRPDLILFSSRSRIIPCDISQPDLSLFQSIGLLTGLKPAASILIVDACDSDSYIRDSIEALRIMGQSATMYYTSGLDAWERGEYEVLD